MIRAKLLTEIEKTLASTDLFQSEDFVLSASEDKNSKDRIDIRYRFERSFWFVAVFSDRKASIVGDRVAMTHTISLGLCPGEMNKVDNFLCTNKEDLLVTIKVWLTYLYAELAITPISMHAAAQQAQVEDLQQRIDAIPEDQFSKEEAQELRRRLEEFQKEMASQLNDTIKDKEELKSKLISLQKDFELLKVTVESLNKRNWAGSLLVRVNKWKRNNLLPTLQINFDATRNFLPDFSAADNEMFGQDPLTVSEKK